MRLFSVLFMLCSLMFHAQHYTSQRYGMNEGLPQNSIKDIIKDKYGFLWMTTDNGILRYDGKNFLLFNDFKVKNVSFKDFLRNENNDFISFNNNDENSVLIVGRNVKVLPSEGAFKNYTIFNKNVYKRFYKNSFDYYFSPEVYGYFIETNSGIYFFGDKKIIYKDKKGFEKIITSNFKVKNLRNVFEHDGIIYIADIQNKRIIALNKGLKSYLNDTSLYNDPKSRIYWHQGNKQVFVINNGSIYISKVVNGIPTLTFLIEYKEIEKEFLYCIFYDEENQKLYFGNVVKGLNVINLSNFYIPQKNIPYMGEVTYEAMPFSENSVITKFGFEYSRDKVKKNFPTSVRNDRRFLLYDNSDNILYTEFNKVQRKLKSSQYKKNESVEFHQKQVQNIFKTDKNFIVGVTDLNFKNYFLYVFSDDRFKKAENIFKFSNSINFVKQYTDDLLYVGTSEGIYLLSLSKKKVIKHFAKDLIIKEIQKLDDGTFWFTTYNNGIYFLKNTEIIKMPYDKTGEIANAHHMLEDSGGSLWISSNNGLFKVSKKMLLNYVKDRNSKVTYYRYTTDDGFLNNEFNGSANPSGNILENGDFVFPSMEGFVFFKPKEIKTHYPKPNQIFIERAKNVKNTISFKDTLRLRSDYKDVEIYFDIPYYHNIENIYVGTKLENGENSKWEDAKSDRKYILSHVSPGNYTLTVRFLISENGDFAYKKIFIEIEPFFYETMWFKTLGVLLVIMLILLVIQMRTNFLKRTVKTLKTNLNSRNQQLKETADNLEMAKNKFKNESEYQQKMMESISHDITTPVKFITLLSQKLTEVEDPLSQKKYFDGLYKASEQLYKFTLGLKGYSELYKEEKIVEEEEYYLHEIIETKRLLFEPIATNNDTTIKNLCDPELKIKANKKILSTILHNLIDNAVKYTHSGEILIKVDEENDKIEIGIFDTGKGMSQRQLDYYSEVCEKIETENFVFKNYGLGLHMVIQLSQKINAKISFQVHKPTGTIVKIFLKTTNNE